MESFLLFIFVLGEAAGANGRFQPKKGPEGSGRDRAGVAKPFCKLNIKYSSTHKGNAGLNSAQERR